MKKLFWVAASGGFFGALLTGWLSPHIIVWYFSPPADIGISCQPAVEWAIQVFRKVMLTGVLLFSILAVILNFAFSARRESTAGAQNVPSDLNRGV